METVQVRGLSELGEALNLFGQKIALKYLRAATSDAAAVFRDDAKARAPVLTGAMRDAIAIFKRPNPAPNAVKYAVGVGKLRISKKIRGLLRRSKTLDNHIIAAGNEFYWRFVEFGTSKMKARPFLRPALVAMTPAAIEKFRLTLSLGVDQAARDAAKMPRT